MLNQYQAQLLNNRHRGVVVISGTWQWCLTQLPNLDEKTLWLGDDASPQATQVKTKQAQQWLGRECNQLVINGFDGIDLNALGALTGTVKAGGCCFILCPPFDQWQSQKDKQSERFSVYPEQEDIPSNRWLKHFVQTIQSEPCAAIIQENQSASFPSLLEQQAQPYDHLLYKTEQQKLAVEKLIKVATGHRRRPLVLTADRGRGKSSSLGLAIVELLRSGKSKIIISAPQVSAVHAVFERIEEQLEVSEQSTTGLKTSEGEIQFVPPDELIRAKQNCDLLMIDEAAAIPAPMLTKLLKAYSRIAFTSTISGYEGTGRSFEIRFKKTLNRLTPDWQAFSMSQPVRYGENDPLERFINNALMLDALAADIKRDETGQWDPDDLILKHWDRDELLTSPQAFSEIMGLLVLSHYKTSPNDLRHLLDGSNIQLYSYQWQGKIIATTLLAIEGGFPDDIGHAVFQGKRRPKGHLLPQTLGFHGGFVQATQMRYARVIRIAVHPEIQHSGIGSKMLSDLTKACSAQNLDFIGSSFGATKTLIGFWHNNEFTTVRLGMTVEASSNEYSAVVLKSLTASGRELLHALKAKFDREFSWSVDQFFERLSNDVLLALLLKADRDRFKPLSENEQTQLQGYLEFNREYEYCAEIIYRHTLQRLTSSAPRSLDEQQTDLLLNKILRKHSWQRICEELNYSGKKTAQQALKQVLNAL